ncbi:RDD family protein [Lysobacter auxotrophicus]|uniref:RDD family protein n=1 Tax=Lysobacter auxotrophicus TaxID=2992573 RepID=A0ABM8D8S5_9GAMM|nr:RDD family protein [Lysobacter auxotrophicus]BDU14946.1 RDD family protein [Lysobacter auxotrophicus]
MSAPARLLPRYAAWSLDAALVAALIAPFLWGRMTRELHALEQTFVACLDRIYGALAAQMDAGGAPDAFAMVSDPSIRQAIGALQAGVLHAVLVPTTAFAVAMFAWQVAGEQSRWQASPGKRLLRLRVVDADGRAPTLARSIGREFAGLLSWATLNLGHAMAAVPPEHVALHDRLSGTRVVRENAPLPAWVRGWVVLQAGIAAALTMALMGHLASLAQAAVERALG